MRIESREKIANHWKREATLIERKNEACKGKCKKGKQQLVEERIQHREAWAQHRKVHSKTRDEHRDALKRER